MASGVQDVAVELQGYGFCGLGVLGFGRVNLALLSFRGFRNLICG